MPPIAHARPWGAPRLERTNLEGSDLRGADLRGAKLGGADLRGADLRDARTGLGRAAAVGHVLAAMIVASVGGFTASWIGEMTRRALQSSDPAAQVGGALLGAELALSVGIAGWRGTSFAATHFLAPTLALLLASAFGLAVLHGSPAGAGFEIAGLTALIAIVFAAVTLARAGASAVHGAALVPVLAAWTGGALLASGRAATILVAVGTAVAGSRALGGSATSPRLTRWTRKLATLGGTCFRGADLRGAKLAGATLRCSDFRGARVDGVDWTEAREVRLCQFDAGASPPRPSATHQI